MSSELRLRRHAIEIVGQLPERPTDARQVLKYALELIDGFLCSQDASAGTTPNLRAISSDSPAGSLSRIHPTVRPGMRRAND